MKKILDAWALLAWLQDEQPAAKKVQMLLEKADSNGLHLAMSFINIGEVYYRIAKRKNETQAKDFLIDLKQMPIQRLPVSNRLILEAAQWKARYPISYADAFAVATAIQEKAALVSGDPELRTLDLQGIIELEWIGIF